MTEIYFLRASNPDECEAIDRFLDVHNARGRGSTKGYVARYAAARPGSRPLADRLVAAAKICPLHSPRAAGFFGGEAWRHVYCLQRLAASRAPENQLSRFLAWCLRQAGRDPRIWYVASYADAASFDPRTGLPHDGGIYRAANAVYCGLTRGKRVEAYVLDGQRHSVRRCPRTLRLAEIPAEARLIRGRPLHRYCWAVGRPLQRRARHRALAERMKNYRFIPAYQPRLLTCLVRRLSVATQTSRRITPFAKGIQP